MAKINRKTPVESVLTYGGAPAQCHLTLEQQLRRSVMSCFLWENEFYEDGTDIAQRISALAEQVSPAVLARTAIEARTLWHLRHVPLLLLTALCKTGAGTRLVSDTIRDTIQRADELSELLAIYWKINGKDAALSAQLKKGLAAAFTKFSAHGLAKYNGDRDIKLRDVMFLTHPKPKTSGGFLQDGTTQADTFKKLANKELPSPDTWEVALSAGANKKETFERLIREGNLGYFALIRNLRGMTEAKVDHQLIRDAIVARKNGADKLLPFRFIMAAKYAPQFERELDLAMQSGFTDQKPGLTVVVVDISGSMGSTLATKGEVRRIDAACGLAAVARGSFSDCRVFATAGNDGTRVHATAEVPSRNGIALIDAIKAKSATLGGGGIFLTPSLRYIQEHVSGDVKRLIVITDEQDCAANDRDRPDLAVPFAQHNYLLNVGSYKNGIGYGKWTHIDGFSDASIRYILMNEEFQEQQQ